MVQRGRTPGEVVRVTGFIASKLEIYLADCYRKQGDMTVDTPLRKKQTINEEGKIRSKKTSNTSKQSNKK